MGDNMAVTTKSIMVGENIRAARKKADITQEALAQKIGVKRAVISKYETGEISPTVAQLQNIANALDVPAMSLIPTAPQQIVRGIVLESLLKDAQTPQEDIVWQAACSPEKQRMNIAFDKLNNEGQEKAIERIEELTEIPKYQRQDE